MQISFFKTQQHTDYNNPFINQKGFDNVTLKNQPNKSIYTITPTPKHWWLQGDPVKFLMGVTAYIHLGNKIGFGINDEGVNWKTVPRIIDRASPFMWV